MSATVYRDAAARAADVLELHGVPSGVSQHVAGNALVPLAMGDERDLRMCFAQVLRELPSAGFRQPLPQLSEEQIERASSAAAVVVEDVLSQSLAVGAYAEDPVGSEGESDRQRRHGVVIAHGIKG